MNVCFMMNKIYKENFKTNKQQLTTAYWLLCFPYNTDTISGLGSAAAKGWGAGG